ncbi:MAG: BON domain-containing protein [Actinomycetota bacterium]
MPRLVTGGSSDVLAEARLRIALTRDPLARGARDLRVRVVDGEAILRGRVPSAIRGAAFEAARRTKDIRHVRDEIEELPDRSRMSRRRIPTA